MESAGYFIVTPQGDYRLINTLPWIQISDMRMVSRCIFARKEIRAEMAVMSWSLIEQANRSDFKRSVSNV